MGSNAYTVVCPHCGAVHEGFTGYLKLTKFTVKNVATTAFDLPIGIVGKVKDIQYKVIGCIEKKEKGTNFRWLEYLLYNPIQGYAYLSEYNGHWIYLTEINLPEQGFFKKTIKYGKENYDIFSKYKSVVVKIWGEFPYSIDIKANPLVVEFIHPPYMISSEKTDGELAWYKGEYIDSVEIKKGFALEKLAAPVGTGMIQPFVSKFRVEFFKQFLVAVVLLFALTQMFFIYDAKDETVYSHRYYVNDSMSNKEIYTESFKLSEGIKNVEIKIATNINNNWMYVGATLINEGTGDVYDLDLEAEYYYGYDGGESWSEGKDWNSKVLSSIPGGTYYLVLYPVKPQWPSSILVDVSLKRDVPVISNLFVCYLVLAIFPAFYFYRRDRFERNRWYNSNYSPYDD